MSCSSGDNKAVSVCVNPVCGITWETLGAAIGAPVLGKGGVCISSNKKSAGLINSLKLVSSLKLLNWNLRLFNVGRAIKKGFTAPMFLAISANLFCMSSDGKYGEKRALSNDA